MLQYLSSTNKMSDEENIDPNTNNSSTNTATNTLFHEFTNKRLPSLYPPTTQQHTILSSHPIPIPIPIPSSTSTIGIQMMNDTNNNNNDLMNDSIDKQIRHGVRHSV